jgi:hypothetical protein
LALQQGSTVLQLREPQELLHFVELFIDANAAFTHAPSITQIFICSSETSFALAFFKFFGFPAVVLHLFSLACKISCKIFILLYQTLLTPKLYVPSRRKALLASPSAFPRLSRVVDRL